MVKCPFCGYDNEEGSLFCEQCKSDLSAAAPSPAVGTPVPGAQIAEAQPYGAATPVAEAVPAAEGYAAPAEPAVPVAPQAELAAEAIPVAVPESVTEPAAPGVTAKAEVLETIPIPPSASPEILPSTTPTAGPVAETVSPAAVSSPPAAAPVAPSAPAPGPAAPAAPVFPPGSQPRLKVIRGMKIGDEFPIYEGENFIGRADEKPVDIDLEYQEPPDRIWTSRQHAVIIFDNGQMHIEDLNSANGTYVNRQRVYPGEKRVLKPGDVIQIGTVQMRVVV